MVINTSVFVNVDLCGAVTPNQVGGYLFVCMCKAFYVLYRLWGGGGNVFNMYRILRLAHLKIYKTGKICTGPYVHKYEKTWEICIESLTFS